jgi:endoglycosylceramidase
MKTPTLIRAAVAAGILMTVTVMAGPASAEPPAPRPQQHGRWLVDPDGRVMVLHGVNMVNKTGSHQPGATGFGADDAAFLAAQGFTTVRLGLIWKSVEPSPGAYDDAYLASVKETTKLLAAEGIWTLLDFHQDLYNERFQGEGAPDWAVQDDGLPAEPKLGFPLNYFGMLALNRAFDHFWKNAPGPGGVGLQDRYAASWRHVAEYFSSTPGVMGFDLFNEPWPGTTYALCANPLGCPGFDKKLSAFSQRANDAIRTVDPDTVTFYEPNVLFNSGAHTSVKVAGDNLGFSFHDYCLADLVGGTVPLGLDRPVCLTLDRLLWANMEQHVKQRSVTPLLTEFGASDNLTSLQDMVDRGAEHRTGWQYWAYCGCADPTTTGSGDKQALVLDPHQPPTGKNVKTDKLRALAIPHPTAVSGIPTSYIFKRSTGQFDLTYSTAKAAGGGSFAAGSRTTVAVPAIQYPNGYSVTVQGATVVSPPNARELVLEQRPGTAPIHVTVRKS